VKTDLEVNNILCVCHTAPLSWLPSGWSEKTHVKQSRIRMLHLNGRTAVCTAGVPHVVQAAGLQMTSSQCGERERENCANCVTLLCADEHGPPGTVCTLHCTVRGDALSGCEGHTVGLHTLSVINN
jgi:hypothetical protein